MAIDTTITTIHTTTPSPTTKILRSQTTRFFPALLDVWPHEKMKQHGGRFRGAPLAVVWLYMQDQRSPPLESGFATQCVSGQTYHQCLKDDLAIAVTL